MRHKLTFVLLFVAAAAAAQLPPGEFRLAVPRAGIAPYTRATPKVAASREQFLTVWLDTRAGIPALWAARLSRSGALLDAAGIHITSSYSAQPYAALDVASDGSSFLVVWREQNGLKLARVLANGSVTHLPDPGVDGAEVSLVWMGDAYVLFFLRIDGDPDRRLRGVEALVLDRDGRNLLGRRQTVVESPARIEHIDAALGNGGTDVLFLWGDYVDFRLHAQTLPVAVLRAGNAVGVQPIPAATPDQRPLGASVASSGDGYLVTWIVFQQGGGLQYRVRHLDRHGVPDAPALIFDQPGQNLVRPSVTWDGSHYVVALQGATNTVQLFRFTRAGTQVTETPLVIGRFGNWPAVESMGNGETVVAWADIAESGGTTLLYTDLYTSGALRFGGRQAISHGHPDRLAPSAVWRGDHYLAAWQEVDTTRHVVVGRFNAAGQPQGTGVTVGLDANAAAPSLATDGREAVVVWTDAVALRSAHIDALGNVRRTTLVTGANFGSAHIQWNGSEYAVVWSQSVSGTSSVLGLRLGRNGTPLDSSALSLVHGNVRDVASLSWTGSQYAVVFQRAAGILLPVLPWAHELLLLSRDLIPVGSSRPVYSSYVTGRPGQSNAGSLLTWTQFRDGVAQVMAMRIAANGTLLDPQPVELGPSGGNPHAFGVAGGWTVVSGPYAWDLTPVSVGRRYLFAPFLPEGTDAFVVTGGPAPLAVWRQVVNGVPDFFGRFVVERQRAIRRR